MPDMTGGQQAALPGGAHTARVNAAMAAKAAEPPELTYMRQTRNAVVFVAVIVGIVCALSLIGAIVVGSQLSKMNSQLSQLGGGSTSSNCYSQGGTDLSC